MLCGKVWSLNKDYPGKTILKNAEMGEYELRCLKCNEIAFDNYNFYAASDNYESHSSASSNLITKEDHYKEHWHSLKEEGVVIDLGVLALFKSKTKKNIFRFLNTVFSVKRNITLELRELAHVAGINPDTFAYESGLKQRIKSYLKDFEKAAVIEPIKKEDYIKCLDEDRGIYYIVRIQAGNLYDDLSAV